MQTVLVSENDIDIIHQFLIDDNVVAFPTETVFGLGVLRHSHVGFEKLFLIKERETSKAITLMVDDSSKIDEICYVSGLAKKIIDEFMPGRLTIVLPLKKKISIGSLELNYIGIRIPDNELTMKILKKSGDMWVTSANISNKKDLYDYKDVEKTFSDKVSAIVQLNALGDIPSTVIKVVEDDIEILRRGSISEAQIQEAIK